MKFCCLCLFLFLWSISLILFPSVSSGALMSAGVNEKTSDESGVAKWAIVPSDGSWSRRKASEESGVAQWAIVHADGNRRQRKGGRGLCGIAKWGIVPWMGAGFEEKASEDCVASQSGPLCRRWELASTKRQARIEWRRTVGHRSTDGIARR